MYEYLDTQTSFFQNDKRILGKLNVFFRISRYYFNPTFFGSQRFNLLPGNFVFPLDY